MWAEKISFLKIMNQSNGFKVSEDGEKERNERGKNQGLKKNNVWRVCKKNLSQYFRSPLCHKGRNSKLPKST